MGKTTQNCAELALKLRSLYAHFKLHEALTPRITGPSALAEELELSRSTIDRWVRKVEDANRDAFQVAPKDILRLARLLLKVAPGQMTEDEAVRLWQRASAAEFTRRLIAPGTISVDHLLTQRAKGLIVEAGPVEEGLSMVEPDLEPIEGELVLKPGQPFALQAKNARPGRVLVVLGEGPTGWFLLAPSPDFDGKVARAPQRFPTRIPGWKISSSTGPHRIVAIELSSGSAPLERKRQQTMVLTPDRDRILVEELLDINGSGDWRWGEALLLIKPDAV